jgi:hypothetical protein
MSTGLKIAAGVVGGLLALVIGVLAASEMSEVVVLTTTDATGAPQRMREKYGTTDLLIAILEGSPQPFPVRLEPRAAH